MTTLGICFIIIGFIISKKFGISHSPEITPAEKFGAFVMLFGAIPLGIGIASLTWRYIVS